MDNRKIGVFDSGLGGLTAVKEIMNLFPNESIVYFGDTGRVPYGTRSKETIVKYTHDDINFLLSQDVKMIIIACGTASSAALPDIKGEYGVPIYGVVDAGAYEASRVTKNNKIGIIGTTATIKSGAYEKYIAEYNPDAQTFKKACPLFVPLVENGHFDTPVTKLVIEEYLKDIREAGVDTLILGCTHYPLIAETIAEYMGDEVTLISAGDAVARECAEVLRSNDMLNDGNSMPSHKFYVTDRPEGFARTADIFLKGGINGSVEQVRI